MPASGRTRRQDEGRPGAVSLDGSATALSEMGARGAPAVRGHEGQRDDHRRPSLLWLVLLANGSVLVVATLLLVVTPITISAPIALTELAVIVAGLLAMLALNFVLLRRVLAPFARFTELMRSIDPDRPGRRLVGVEPRTSEGIALMGSFNAMLDKLEHARREAARTALVAQEAERARVSRELHDGVGQSLTAVLIQAERAAEGPGGRSAPELERIAETVRSSLEEVRRIARELRPEALDDLGLRNALIALCRRAGAEGGASVAHDLAGELPSLSPDVELVIYRVVQEALTNALRHAEARSVLVSLAASAEGVAATVADDGRGMSTPPPSETVGLRGMRERALLAGAELSIESRPGEGTEVRLIVPLDVDDAP